MTVCAEYRDVDVLVVRRCRCEVACLVKFRIIWDVLLWHESEQSAAEKHSGNIVETCVQEKRKSGHDDHIHCCGGTADLLQPCKAAVKKDVLQEQIITGIARDTKLREYQKFHMFLLRLLHTRQDMLRVEGGIAYFDIRGGCGDLDKSIFHDDVILSDLFYSFIIPESGEKAT